MSEDGVSAWHEVLHARLEASGRSDDSIIEFIEEEVPDEGNILDYKQDLYLSASSSHHKKKRQANLMKHFSALANVRTSARFRYIFIGFNNDGDFIGMQHREPRDGEQVLDVDDADLRNVFADKVSPSPDFKKFELEQNGDRGGVIVIRQGEQVPLVIEKTLRKQDGTAFIYEGQAYSRDGSRSARMTSDDFAAMMRYREKLITEKIQQLTEGLSQVVGIPDDQLANLNLNVTESEDGVPIQELVTMDAPKSIDEELKTAVKGSKGSGGFEYQRRGLYEFLAQKDGVNINNEGGQKIEFLVRASLRHHLHGGYWLAHYNGNIDEFLEKIISEDITGNTIRPLERILLVLGKQAHLREIDQTYRTKYSSSNANKFERMCDRGIHLRVSEYVGDTVKIDSDTYSVADLIYQDSDVDPTELIEKVVDGLLTDDNSTGRARLRKMELIYLAANY